MTVNEMKSQLAVTVEDENDVIISAANKIIFLQNAQIELAMLIDNNYLTEIEYVKESVTATAGVMNMTAAVLGFAVFKGKMGILHVKIHDEFHCELIDYSELRERQNSYFSGGRQDPYAYVFQNKIYSLFHVFL